MDCVFEVEEIKEHLFHLTSFFVLMAYFVVPLNLKYAMPYEIHTRTGNFPFST